MTQPLKETTDNEEMPRERLRRHGPGSLSNSELLAILLRIGSVGENVMDLSARILRESGGFRNLSRMDLDHLTKIKGIGLAKAVQLKAALEIASRLQREEVTATPLNHPRLVYDLMAPQMLTFSQEVLMVICCDTRLRPVSIVEVSKGTSNQTLAHAPDILKKVLLSDGNSFVLVHNHPSGDPSPSRADIAFTKRLKEASDLLDVKLVDHVIIGSPAPRREPFYSFAEDGEL